MPYIDSSRRSKPLPELPPNDNDSDHLSPQLQPRVSLHVNALKNVPRPSADRARNTLGTPTPMINKTRDKTNDVLKEEPGTLRFEQSAQTTNRVIGPLE